MKANRLRHPLSAAPLRVLSRFVDSVFAHRRLREMLDGPWAVGDLVRFHTREKLLLLAHDRTSYTALGRLVADAAGRSRGEVARAYEDLFLQALRQRSSRGKHTDVLQHAAGYFRKLLSDGERRELQDVIERYQRGLVPLAAPLTQIRQHVRRHRVAYLAQQSYFERHPAESMLSERISTTYGI